jgi:hypothetical protein
MIHWPDWRRRKELTGFIGLIHPPLKPKNLFYYHTTHVVMILSLGLKPRKVANPTWRRRKELIVSRDYPVLLLSRAGVRMIHWPDWRRRKEFIWPRRACFSSPGLLTTR